MSDAAAGEVARRRRILVATKDVIAPRMAGPAIRAWQVAVALSAEHDIELVTTASCDAHDDRFVVRSVTEPDLVELERWCDVIVFQGNVLHESPALQVTEKVVVADVYDPLHLEQLEQARDAGEDMRRHIVTATTAILNRALLRADFLLCASEKQRDFWLGQLAGLGRVNTATYDADPTLRSLIDVAPFGVEEEPPAARPGAIKGVVPGIEADDVVLLWGGGVYNWFDPLTLIRAVERVYRDHPAVRLYFLGMAHPNPDVPRMRMAGDAVALSDELGLTDRVVFFNTGWVRYDERAAYLLDADVGVTTHLDHVETAFSFRTRVLDYLWAGLPVVSTGGDALADLVVDAGAGIAVPPGDVDALAEALAALVADPARRARLSAAASVAASSMRWSDVLAPLVAFCRDPRRAPDLVDATLAPGLVPTRIAIPANPTSLRGDVALAAAYLRQGGPRLFLRRVATRARRVIRRT